MWSAEKIVKTTLRWSTPLLVIAALGCTTHDGIFVAGQIWTAPQPMFVSESPDGRYRALIYQLRPNDESGTQLILEHKFHGIALGQFTALDSAQPVAIRLRWTGPSSLQIICDRCDRRQTDLPITNWGKLHLSYDLERTPS